MKNRNNIFLLLLIILSFGLGACAGQQQQLPAPEPEPAVQIKAPEKKPAPRKNISKVKPIAKETEPAIAPPPPSPKPKPQPVKTIKSGGKNMIIIGETEYVTIKPKDIRLKARIDTGATTSSIHALDIVRYERDGKKWVRFNLVNSSGAKIKMERPIVKIIKVKRHGEKDQVRPVVNLQIAMGKIKKTTPFSLIDRSNFKYPVLIGRTFLENTAVVDVTRSYTLSPLSGEDHEK